MTSTSLIQSTSATGGSATVSITQPFSTTTQRVILSGVIYTGENTTSTSLYKTGLVPAPGSSSGSGAKINMNFTNLIVFVLAVTGLVMA
ncbi:hypothetical protein JCM33374_g13 [Metschnikowia sp. JCM 33374]|nr:hypothetical protein JCM33374_g13 [Metschnikowia sp. JCM 33374]